MYRYVKVNVNATDNVIWDIDVVFLTHSTFLIPDSRGDKWGNLRMFIFHQEAGSSWRLTSGSFYIIRFYHPVYAIAYKWC